MSFPAGPAQRVQAAVVSGARVGVRLHDPATLEGVVGEHGPGERERGCFAATSAEIRTPRSAGGTHLRSPGGTSAPGRRAGSCESSWMQSVTCGQVRGISRAGIRRHDGGSSGAMRGGQTGPRGGCLPRRPASRSRRPRATRWPGCRPPIRRSRGPTRVLSVSRRAAWPSWSSCRARRPWRPSRRSGRRPPRRRPRQRGKGSRPRPEAVPGVTKRRPTCRPGGRRAAGRPPDDGRDHEEAESPRQQAVAEFGVLANQRVAATWSSSHSPACVATGTLASITSARTGSSRPSRRAPPGQAAHTTRARALRGTSTMTECTNRTCAGSPLTTVRLIRDFSSGGWPDRMRVDWISGPHGGQRGVRRRTGSGCRNPEEVKWLGQELRHFSQGLLSFL